jgi:hypothetical protein
MRETVVPSYWALTGINIFVLQNIIIYYSIIVANRILSTKFINILYKEN